MARVRPTLAAALATVICGAATTLTPTGAAAAEAPCPDANLTPTQGNLPRVRAAVLCLIDRERERAGEGALQANAHLQAAAQAHSEDMAARGYFDHVGPSGDTPLDRMRASGYVAGANSGYEVGENIAWGTEELATPRAIVDAWMQSSEHRANILDGRFRDTAIGVSTRVPAAWGHGQPGAIYTQDFGVLLGGRAARSGAAHRRRRAADNLRPSSTTRRSKGHGSTRRKVRHRHGLGARHRPRHRRAARGAGRKRAGQRSRRRRR